MGKALVKVKRTVLKSDFDYRNPEFTGQAIANRRFRHRKITPIMKWEFTQDMLRLMTNIRNVRASIDNHPPETPSTAVMNKNRQKVEEGRLRVIETENHEMLERLHKIHNRPKSYFCHLKKRGVPLIKGDAYRLHPPSGRGLYLLQMYKKLKLANPISARKSIRVQQEMLTSAIEIVQSSNRNKPSEELIDSVVQMKLATVDEVPSPDGASSASDNRLSPVELVKRANPNPDGPSPEDFEKLLDTSPTSPSDSGSESTGKTSKTQREAA